MAVDITRKGAGWRLRTDTVNRETLIFCVRPFGTESASLVLG
jgi:hypothetical protein